MQRGYYWENNIYIGRRWVILALTFPLLYSVVSDRVLHENIVISTKVYDSSSNCLTSAYKNN